ncbi:flavin reductase family protein [Aliidiomarina sanyensis]|uniref:Flavin reductase family protein n=1 Tax=Aliidiomarina sanyensis TaxID=1249555 RepID=A0A432WRV0_9GAMM|nr:flavin reductase family protein [Aliidiomarina sanyensis]RUO36526.1 flavin reductase family protein [Aliidiomarina sanyensis]
MMIDTAGMSGTAIYHLMTQTLIPRPIAWVLTKHTSGHLNLAPFSYFTAVTSEPPLLMFSVGNKVDGSGKDTKVNAQENGYFVVHIPSGRHAEAVTESSRALPAAESELDRLNHIKTVPFEGFPLPRLEDCAIAFGCRLHHTHAIPGAPQTLLFGEIKRVYLADEVARIQHLQKGDGQISERLVVSAQDVDPLARLGADEYARLGEFLRVPRPK